MGFSSSIQRCPKHRAPAYLHWCLKTLLCSFLNSSRRSHVIMFQRICWNRFVYFCCGEDLHKIFRDLHRNQSHNGLCTCRWFEFHVEGLMAAGETVASSWIIQDWLGYGSNSAAKMDLHLLNTINQIWVSGKIRSLQHFPGWYAYLLFFARGI